MSTFELLIILGIGFVPVGPILFIVIRSLRAEGKMTRLRDGILKGGIPVKARLLTMGPSPVSAAHPGGTKLLRLTVQPTTPVNGEPVTIDQPIPTLALGGFHPGMDIAIRLSPSNPREAAVDLLAMGYRL